MVKSMFIDAEEAHQWCFKETRIRHNIHMVMWYNRILMEFVLPLGRQNCNKVKNLNFVYLTFKMHIRHLK